MRRTGAALGAILIATLLAFAPSARAASPVVGVAPAATGSWVVDAAGHVSAVDGAPALGSVGGPLSHPIVGMAATRTGRGYWLVASDGGIFTFGDAAYLGSTGALRLARPIVGMAPTRSGRGYWLVASDGGIFTFGDARFLGSTGALRLARPIVGMAATPDAGGYWLVASDGGIFAFGDARFAGSTGALPLASVIVGMAPTGTGAGYWLVAGDGGVFSFGDARFAGRPTSARAVAPTTGGYRIAGADGRVRSFVASVTSATSSPVPAVPSTPVAAPREAWRWPFSSTSPWNMPIGSLALFEPSAAPKTATLTSTRATPWINAGDYSIPIYRAASTDPLGTFRRSGHPDVTIHVPSSARPANGSDQHMVVVDPSGRWADESWKTGGANPSWTTGYLVHTDLYGPGVGQEGVRAYGGSAIGGLIRSWELDSGAIRHALALSLSADQLGRGPVWPATREDGNAASSYTGNVPMGTLAAIPGSVDVTKLGLSPAGLIVARAMQDYGVYVVDRSSAFVLYAEPTLQGTPALTAMRADLGKIRAQLRVVTDNTAATVGGGGVPRAPLAPPLG
jgi:hypothetical protein